MKDLIRDVLKNKYRQNVCLENKILNNTKFETRIVERFNKRRAKEQVQTKCLFGKQNFKQHEI